VKVKEIWERPLGHKQGNQYGKAGEHTDKRFSPRSTERNKFRKELE